LGKKDDSNDTILYFDTILLESSFISTFSK